MLRSAFILIFAACPFLAQTAKKPVTVTYDKVKVTDDYRWLENFDDPAVKEWANTPDRAPAEQMAITVMAMVAPILQVPFARMPEPALLNS